MCSLNLPKKEEGEASSETFPVPSPCPYLQIQHFIPAVLFRGTNLAEGSLTLGIGSNTRAMWLDKYDLT